VTADNGIRVILGGAVAIALVALILLLSGPPTRTAATSGKDIAADTTVAPVSPVAQAVSPEDPVADDAVPEAGAARPEADDIAAATDPGAATAAPGFDTVRVEADGRALVAGRAAPGAAVSVILGGAVVAEVTADAGGAFFVQIDLPASDDPQAMTLLTGGTDGVPSEQTVIVGAIAGSAPQVAGTAPPAPQVASNPPSTEVPGLQDAGGDAPDRAVPDVASPPARAPAAPDIADRDGAPATQALPPGIITAPEPDEGADPVVSRAEDAPLAVPAPAPPPSFGTAPPPVGGIAPPPVVVTVEGPEPAAAGPVADPPQIAVTPVAAGPARVDAALTAPAVEAAPVADGGAVTVAPRPAVEPGAPELAGPGATAAPPPVLIVDADGVRTMRPSRPAPVAQADAPPSLALDTIAYDAGGDVALSGRAPAGGLVRLYLDGAIAGEAAVDETGTWARDLPEVAPGTYTLRVDRIGPGGDVTDRMETPFLREDRATLAQVLGEGDGPVRTVQAGNTLWGISRERYGDGFLYVRVFDANRDLIRDPNLIYPGQILRLPEGE